MFDQYAAPENAGLGMFLRSATDGRLTGSLLNWRRIIGAGGDQPGESQRGFSLLKYVSPTWNGFTFAADWVVTDFWDVALRYRKEIAGFEIAAGIGYLQLIPGSRTRSVCPVAFLAFTGEETACSQLRGSVSALHLDTGLFVNFGASATGDGLVDETTRYRKPASTTERSSTPGRLASSGHFLALGKTTSMPTTIPITAELRRRCWSVPGTRSTRPASVNWAVWRSDVDIWVAASPRASIAPP